MTLDRTYHPTLWRTCRVLANARRLACLRVVMGTPNLCVQEIAREVRFGEAQVSLALRALQARGLIAALPLGRQRVSDEITLDLRQCQPYPFHTLKGVK
ncbi:MAG TPA: helix-turn-helix transcriptional regulator [Kiritimatiellia bacterium]|nr:helix-turn-helix transcriptional regulator [Kiritimatiellia bacterium]